MNNQSDKKILITGCAGFIGMHLSELLVKNGYDVIGVDNLNNYYDVNLKLDRLKNLNAYHNFKFEKIDITDKNALSNIFITSKPFKVVNLAAQAGVRYSLTNPQAYIESNVSGFVNVLESCRYHGVEGLIYASSSSVYGSNEKIPFSEKDRIDKPLSIYGASKISNELMAKSYHSLYGLKSTGLRFFTVYGPWGRPDMAMYIFTKKILENEPIQLFNHGIMDRDFTYIDDIISGVASAVENNYDNEIFNLGNNKSESLTDLVEIIEKKLDKKAIIEFEPMQLGDVKNTFADIEKAKKKLGYAPKFNMKKGVENFIDWYLSYN